MTNRIEKMCCATLSALIFSALLITLLQSSVPAQSPADAVPAPINATVTPATAIAGMKVKITGATEFDGKRTNIKVIVTRPGSAAPVELAGKIDNAGKFEIDFDKTDAPGKYSVKVIAPDEKGTAAAQFEIFSGAAFFARPADQIEKMLQTGVQAAELGSELVKNLPPSDSQGAMLAKIKKIKNHLAGAPAEVSRLRQALAKLAEIPEKYPATTGAFDDLNGKLDAELAEMESRTQTVHEQLKKSRQDGALCENLDTANEIFNAIAFMLDIGQTIRGTIENFANDKGSPRVIEIAAAKAGQPFNDNAKFFVTETLKASNSSLLGGFSSPTGFFVTGVGLLNDFAQFQTAKVFGQYCERFEGPVDGKFGITFYEGQNVFWSYVVTLKGKMALRYAKSAAGGPVAVKGQIEGNATNFDIKENFIIENPNLRRFLVVRKVIPPPTVPYAEDAGSIARMTSPGYFRIPVEGEIIGDKVRLNLMPATSDFSELYKGKTLYVFFSPPLPYFKVFDLPFQKAAFIFSRALRDKPEFEIVTEAAGKSRTMQHDFTRDAKSDKGDFDAFFRVNVKMCNPSCINNKVFEQ